MRVAVTTTESKAAALSARAGQGALVSDASTAMLLRKNPRFKLEMRIFPTSVCVMSQAAGTLKYCPLLPLFKDLSKSSHNRGLSTARIAMIVAASVTAAAARDVHSGFSVSVVVRPVAKIELQSAPSGLDVSAADLRRGYIDVMQPTQFTVRSNSANGYALEVLTVAPLLSSMTVEGLNSDLTLGADGGTIVQRWQKPQAVNVSLKFRFELAPGLSVGSYPWPVRLAVRPLE